MNFNEQLNFYIDKLQCTSKELADASRLSPVVISRYRNGERTPHMNGDKLEHLSFGISKIATDKGFIDLTRELVISSFFETLNLNSINFEKVRKNFNMLISALDINIAEMSRSLSFDASYFSRIRTGKRTPANPENFVNSICNFIVHKYSSSKSKTTICELLNCNINDISSEMSYLNALKDWIYSESKEDNKDINNFLKTLDEFNLNEYIKTIHFDELKIPYIPFYKHSSKTYYGIEQMKQGELDFFKSTVLSKSDEPVFMCNDMPMEDMSKDTDFGKKWMFAIAMTLKKGLHLNIIHNLDRPFNEMMIGLESWIPIYMTGQITPYYLTGLQNTVYCHLDYVSGKVALSGECIKDFHNTGKYYLTSNSEEVIYYKNKARNLLTKAQPLMKIYSKKAQKSFNDFWNADSILLGNRRRILATLPIHSISEDLLLKILKRNKVDDNNIKNILEYVNQEKSFMNIITEKNQFIDEFSEITKEEFEKFPVYLFLANGFFENKIQYNYEEYLSHLNLTKEYATNTRNYSIKSESSNIFKNIQIYIHENRFVMISKSTNPAIHFIINHPKLRNAIENFISPIADN